MTDQDECIAAFEAWAGADDICDLTLEPSDECRYKRSFASLLWEHWQAAWQACEARFSERSKHADEWHGQGCRELGS